MDIAIEKIKNLLTQLPVFNVLHRNAPPFGKRYG